MFSVGHLQDPTKYAFEPVIMPAAVVPVVPVVRVGGSVRRAPVGRGAGTGQGARWRWSRGIGGSMKDSSGGSRA